MGCTKVSPACKNCYAERDFDHRYQKVKWGSSGTRVVTSDANWRKPLRWNREAEQAGKRLRVFCASLADVFEDWQGEIRNNKGETLYHGWHHAQPEWVASATPCDGEPTTMNDVRRRLFSLIDATPHLDWLLLTKRPENIGHMWPSWPVGFPADGSGGHGSGSRYLKNVWLGTSVENQEYAESRIPELLGCRDHAPVLFLSCEPLVGPVDLQNIQVATSDSYAGPDATADDMMDVLCGETVSGETGCVVSDDGPAIDWVICGGESGPRARPSRPDWFRSLRDQCKATGTPFHFKQWGEWSPDGPASKCEFPWAERIPNGVIGGPMMHRVGTKSAGRLLDGETHDGLPV